MIDLTKPTSNNRTFYTAIAVGIVGLFLLLFVPCLIAMCVVRCREKRQERRDALARQLEEGEEEEEEGGGGGEEDTLPEDHTGASVYHVEELGEPSGRSQPQQSDQEPNHASQILHQDEASAQQNDTQGEACQPQLDGKGKSPMYLPQTQRAAAAEQLPEHRGVETAGRFQEHLPEASEQLQDGQEAGEEFQDAQEAAPAQQHGLSKKQKRA
ncbi:hypothetical protein Trco_001475 [Trichoderma cornu-damae]|uniref:receptor protein-tyrosine kinase n=1 Tax=Trichoderma cornu-damae TaxID=654480 RepID=A0A9P8QTZ9_9HYPO|nr:hypothetical protein Trco_001475 [Trichoderma cornu-damae]